MADFLAHLRDVVESGALAAVLRPVHLPCQGLLPFDDFCQGVLVRAVEQGATFRGQSVAEFLGWLRALGKQQLVTLLRKSRLRHQQALADDMPDLRRPSVAEDVAERDERQEKTQWLATALAALEEDERELLLRHYFHEESLADIGRSLGLAPNTLAQRHVRLLKRLRSMREKK